MSFPSSILSMVLRNLSSRGLKKSHIVLLSFTIIARRWSQSYSSLFFSQTPTLLNQHPNPWLYNLYTTRFVKNTIVTVRVGNLERWSSRKKQSPILPPVASSRRVASDTLCGRKNCRSSSSSDDRVFVAHHFARGSSSNPWLATISQSDSIVRSPALASLAIGRRETFGKSRHREYTWSDRRMRMDTRIRIVHLEDAKCILKFLKYP